ncbi:MAG: energy-coupling factor transporter transmembrane protein EcfT [Erysipelotrichaceae bacterium]|nr:energy-coupling factor transporter transmembrane protein EcfT [Erysipelotrichaceae bacterium]MBO7697840.1 energy-coupling factor transporter transmembrane protein EcfT [Erysipelotrichaceae bacterium]MBP5279196.1 energy-coupling factor transporter transmembrane protein EcfT [Erysipelotrichaceae bacterium]
MDEKLFITLTPGTTFIDKLTGKTKVRIFVALIFILTFTWDIRIIAPILVLSFIALLSIKPDKNKNIAIIIFVLVMNIFNLFLTWIIKPDYGLQMVGASTVLFRFNDFFIITKETMWYFLVRLSKFMGMFFLSLTFIQSITPSELSAGLHSIKIHYKICMIVSLAFRYIPDITRDFNNIRISMQTRGVELDSKKASLMKRLKQYVLILVPLLITSFDRVGNIANAMDLRGFGKNKDKTYYCEHEDTKGDKFLVPFIVLAYIGLIVLIFTNIFYKSEFEVWAPWI